MLDALVGGVDARSWTFTGYVRCAFVAKSVLGVAVLVSGEGRGHARWCLG